MNDEGKRKHVIDFLKQHTLAVMATTAANGHPQAAVVEFSETDDLEIIFDTFSSYRKYKNLQRDARVAFAIGWDDDETVQYQGVAHQLSGGELKKYQSIHLTKLPKAKKFVGMEQTRYFKVTPTWIRYSNLRVNPWEVFEVTF